MAKRLKENIKTPLLVAVSISFVILLLFFIGGTTGMLQRHLSQMISGKIDSVYGLMATEIDRENESLANLIQPILMDEKLKNYFVSRDRTALLRSSQDLFNRMLGTNGVTHFYFHGLDKVNYLRVHKPERHSDLINRYTLNMAEETGQPFGGFELGPLGTFTLRMVRPWYDKGELIGYVELGKEIDSTVQRLSKILDIGIFIALSKSKFTKKDWQERENFIGGGTSWDLLPSHVLTNYSNLQTPDELTDYLARNENMLSSPGSVTQLFRTHLGAKVFRGGILPLADVSGENVGDVIVIMDVTDDEHQMSQMLIWVTLVCLVLCGVLLIFFNIYLRKIEEKLNLSRENLRTEIDERRRAETLLKNQKAFLKHIINSIAYPFYVINVEDYTISLSNKACGFSESSLGQTCYRLTHQQETPCSGKDHPCTIELIKKTGEPVVVEHVHYDESGARNIIEIHGYPVFDSAGKLIEVIEHTQDITERKVAEEGLFEAMSVATDANIAKSEFLANMSHEIRTPMNGIIGFTDLLAKMELTDKQKEYVGLIKNSGNRLMDIVTDILDFSKIEAQTLTLNETVFDLKETLSETLSFMAPKLREKGLNLNFECTTDFRKRIGDHGRLRQILINLLNNAIKFTEQGGVTVTVGPVPDNLFRKGTVLFAVSDTGMGIPVDKRELIFSSFYQVDGSSTRKHGGAGLGLAICKQLVDMMGGEIWVEDSPGKGSVFKFTLDLGTSDERSEETQQVSEVATKDLSPTEKKQVRILLVEDEPINQILATEVLEQHGYVVEVAENGRVAVDRIIKSAGDEFNMVLMDIQMPVLDGLDATRLLRESEKQAGGKHLPIIAMTAHAFQQNRVDCLKAGMDDYIAKPINPDTLHSLIEQYAGLGEKV